jgi:acyl-CoA thioesterase-1
MRFRKCFFWLGMFLAGVAVAEGELRILAIGDSITHGGIRGRKEYTYRLPLQRMLLEREIPFRFVGTRVAGFQRGTTWPDVAEGVPFQPNHFSFYGGRTADVARDLRDELPRIDPPDVALVHLGTNDLNTNRDETAILAPLRDMIGQLRARNPEVIVLLGHLNFNDGPALRLRPKMNALAEELDTERSPVRTVPMYRGWNENPNHPQTDTFDWLHPNPQGQQKMAEAWFEQLKPLLK